MPSNPPSVSLWLDIPDDCRMAAEYTGDGEIQFSFGDWQSSQSLLFEPDALKRFVTLAGEILAIPEPKNSKEDRPKLESPAS